MFSGLQSKEWRLSGNKNADVLFILPRWRMGFLRQLSEYMSGRQEVAVASAVTSSPSSKPSCDLLKRHFPVAKLDLLLAASELSK
jgi:hypothetical protein